MLVDDRQRLGVDEGGDHLLDRLLDQLGDLLLLPSSSQLTELPADPLQLVVVGPEHLVVGLGDARLEQGGAVQQPGPEQQSADEQQRP